MSAKHGLILFAHGSRDPRWAEPFERLRDKLSAQRPDTDVRLAFLELMAPDLGGAVAAMTAQGVSAITVVPVFLGQGGHVRRDLPALVQACRAAHPTLRLNVSAAIGEDEQVLDALANYCGRMMDGG